MFNGATKVHSTQRSAVVLGNSSKFDDMSPRFCLCNFKLLIKATNQLHTIVMSLTDAAQSRAVNHRKDGYLMSMQNSFHLRMVLYKLESALSIAVNPTSISNMSNFLQNNFNIISKINKNKRKTIATILSK